MTTQSKVLLGIGAGVVIFLLWRKGKQVANILKDDPIMNKPDSVPTDFDVSDAKTVASMDDLTNAAGQVNLPASNPDAVSDALIRQGGAAVEAALPQPIATVNMKDLSIHSAIAGEMQIPNPPIGVKAYQTAPSDDQGGESMINAATFDPLE